VLGFLLRTCVPDILAREGALHTGVSYSQSFDRNLRSFKLLIYLDCDESHSFLRQGQYLLPYPPYPTGCRNRNTSRRLTLEPDVKQELHVISNDTLPLCLRYVYSGVFCQEDSFHIPRVEGDRPEHDESGTKAEVERTQGFLCQGTSLLGLRPERWNVSPWNVSPPQDKTAATALQDVPDVLRTPFFRISTFCICTATAWVLGVDSTG
jgi:hypothetical protein